MLSDDRFRLMVGKQLWLLKNGNDWEGPCFQMAEVFLKRMTKLSQLQISEYRSLLVWVIHMKISKFKFIALSNAAFHHVAI
jgi:hypothetical protein